MVMLPQLAEPERPHAGKRNLQSVLEDIGFGPAQVIASLLGGGTWIADGAEILVLGAITRAVSEEWGLDAVQRGSVVSLVFVGILLGNTASGPLGDGFGRKVPILLSYLGVGLFSVMSASALGFYSLASIRVLVGFAFGLGQPAATTLLSEVSPSRWRFMVLGQSIGLFCLGELFAAFLIWINDPTMRSLDWRWLCMTAALPSVVLLVLAYFFLDESPAYLDGKGYHEEAVKALATMKSRNSAEGVSCEFTSGTTVERTPRSVRDQLAVIYAPSLILTTFTMMFSCFMLNICFYGSLYAFPQVFTDTQSKSSFSPAVVLMVGALAEWPGNWLAPIAERFIRGKVILQVYTSLSAVSLVALTVGANGEGLVFSILLQGGYIGVKTLVSLGWVTVYTVSAAAFPCASRTTGVAACSSAGRLGGILAPFLYEQTASLFGGWEPFFLCLAGGYVLNFISLMAASLEADECAAEDEAKPILGSCKAP